jgi:hypothetical protein
MISNRIKGKSPHKLRDWSKRVRVRGSQPSEILMGIYEKGSVFKCPITGDDPAEYFMKYHDIWIPRRMHHPIPFHKLVKMGVKDPNSLSHVMFGSPNGHNMLDNYLNGIDVMDKSEAETCTVCKINSWEVFQQHKKVLRMENHHEDSKFATYKLCPMCHAATDSHSVNEGKVPFPSKEFAKLIIDDNILNLNTLHSILKKIAPKLNKNAIQYKFYGIGLHRFFDNTLIPPPDIIRKYFPNKNYSKFFC